MYAIVGLLVLAFALWIYSSVKKVTDAPAKIKSDILFFSKCFLVGCVLSAITGIISLFFYPMSREVNAIFLVLTGWVFPMGSTLVGIGISIYKEGNK